MTYNKFIPCRKCKKTNKNPEGYYTKEINGQTILVECPHHIKWRQNKDLKIKYIKNGFSEENFDYTFASYKGEKSISNINRIKNYLKCFLDNDKKNIVKRSILYLYGPNGTQKTTIASMIGKSLIKCGLNIKYVLMKTLIDLLWDSQRDENAKLKINDYLNCDIIIIDESFSKDKIHLWQSGAQIGYIDEFFRERLNLGNGIIFISNTKPEDIENQGFSHSIQDLISRELKKDDGAMLFSDNYMSIASLDNIPSKLF